MCTSLHSLFWNHDVPNSRRQHNILFINNLNAKSGNGLPGYLWRNRCIQAKAEKRSYYAFGLLSQILDQSSLLRLPELIPPT